MCIDSMLCVEYAVCGIKEERGACALGVTPRVVSMRWARPVCHGKVYRHLHTRRVRVAYGRRT